MASRKEQKEALRNERLQREQEQQKSAARKRMVGIVIAAILVLGIAGAVGAVVLSGGDDDDGGKSGDTSGDTTSVDYPDGGTIPEQETADLEKAAKAAGCKDETIEAAGAGQHTEEPVAYDSEPPAIGAHYPDWPEDDIYEEAPRTERLVHTLEHGRVIVWVKPDAPEELLGQVKALYEEDNYHLIVTPRAELKEPIAVSAWVGQNSGHILRCPKPDDKMWDAIRSFKEQYRDKAPEFVP